MARNIQIKTGFNASEVFRKFLWYLLRERKFDSEAVNDVVQLKASLQLSDAEVSQLECVVLNVMTCTAQSVACLVELPSRVQSELQQQPMPKAL